MTNANEYVMNYGYRADPEITKKAIQAIREKRFISAINTIRSGIGVSLLEAKLIAGGMRAALDSLGLLVNEDYE